MRSRMQSFTSVIFISSIVSLLFSGAICNTDVKMGKGNQNKMPLGEINKVKEAHTSELMSISGVVGVYVGQLDDGTPCIGVMVVRKTPELEKRIPKFLEGHLVVIDESGEIRPFKEER